MHRYILSVIEVFSKFLHFVLVKTKSGPSNVLAFRSTFHEDDSRRLYGYEQIRYKSF